MNGPWFTWFAPEQPWITEYTAALNFQEGRDISGRWKDSRMSDSDSDILLSSPPTGLPLLTDMSLSVALSSDSHLVEDVEVPLALVLTHHPRLLQQEVGDFTAIRLTASAELDLKVLALVDRGNAMTQSHEVSHDRFDKSFCIHL